MLEVTLQEKVGVLTFLVVVSAVFVVAAAYAAHWLKRKIRRQGEPKRSAAGKWTRRGLLTAAGTGVGCALWAKLGEPLWPEITHTIIRTNKLRGATGPVRIVQLSDLHCDATVRLENRLPGIIKECKPDIIVFTGDCVNSRAGLDNFRTCITRIAAIAPTYVCKGNWETFFGLSSKDYFDKTGVTELDKKWQSIEVAGTRFTLAGTAVEGSSTTDEGELTKALKRAPADDYTVFLHHYPDAIYTLADTRRVDLQLSGHTHGGQVALPMYGALVTLSGKGKELEWGRYQVKDTTLYINRGIGMEGGRTPRVRFWARPEISVFELVQEA